MIGGGGEQKTLRLVAQYADACNVFGVPESIAHKYAILAEHCAAVGRDPDEIERSTLQNVRLGPTGGGAHRDAGRGRRPASASWPTPAPQHVIFERRATSTTRRRIELLGRDVIPAAPRPAVSPARYP